MFLLVLIVLLLLVAIFAPKFIKDYVHERGDGTTEVVRSFAVVRWSLRGICSALAILCFLLTSCIIIGSDSVGHLTRIYFGKSMPQGRIIANVNEKGPQAKILPPGFHLIPFIRVTHDIDQLPLFEIPPGEYGFVVAKDGDPMPEGQLIAAEWTDPSEMLNAMVFMGYEKGSKIGTKGPQLTELPPGKYRINRYLFDVYSDVSTEVPAGHVAVVKSNIGDDYYGEPILPTGIKTTELSVPIVPKGYRGVWADVYKPGEYYLNRKAYDITIVDTRVQTLKYLGGYKRKWVDLIVEANGEIKQEPHEEDYQVPEDAADSAVLFRVEGWDVWQDSRVQVQVTPENAPFVVASVGGLEEVENKIITPNYRSIARNIVAQDVTVTEPVLDEDGNQIYEEVLDKDGKVVKGAKGKPKMQTITRPRKVLDLLYHRKELEDAVADKLIPAGAQAGVTVQWVRFGDPAVPPSLLIPGKRKQLANSLMSTYKQEKNAQFERVQTEKERARANQQAELMKSEIGIKVAENNADAREKEGLGEKHILRMLQKAKWHKQMFLDKIAPINLQH